MERTSRRPVFKWFDTKEWCVKNGLSTSTLRYWIRRIKNQELNPNEDTIKPTEASIDFAGIIIAADSLGEGALAHRNNYEIIEIQMCDAVLTIPTTFSEDHLLRVIRALRKA